MNYHSQEEVKKRFDDMFKQGNKPWRNHPIEQLLNKFFITLSTQYPHANVLDIGCGDGWTSLLAVRQGFEVWGIDSSSVAIEEAKEEASKEKGHDKAHFQVGDALDLPYEDNFFNAIIDGGLFHHILPENRSIYLNNIVRVLKKDGLLYLSAFSSDTPNKIGYHFTKEEIEELFGKYFTTIDYEKDVVTPISPFATLHFILKRKN